MATVRAISGAGSKGPACFFVEAGEARLLFDLGYGPQPGLWPDVGSVGRVDAIVLSHGHPDHAGGLALADRVGAPPVYATASVVATLDTALETREIPIRGICEICGITVRTGRNGHAPGGVWLHADIGGGLLYTGDYSVESRVYAYDPPPPADTLILDASYGAYDSPLDTCIEQLAPLFDGGASLLPVPPRGRGTEVAHHVARRGGALPHVGDDLRAALREMAAAPERHGVRADAVATLDRLARDAPPIAECRGTMLAGPASGSHGEPAALIERFESAAEPRIVFTGYLPPGTPAQRLTESGRARYVRWNVHPRLSDNAALVRSTRARTVLPAFGDRRHRDAWAQAFAPARIVIDEPIPL